MLTLKSGSVMTSPNAAKFSLTLFAASGVMVYRVPFKATPSAAVAPGDAKIIAALLKAARVIMESLGSVRFVAGLVSVAIRVPAGITVPSWPVQSMR